MSQGHLHINPVQHRDRQRRLCGDEMGIAITCIIISLQSFLPFLLESNIKASVKGCSYSNGSYTHLTQGIQFVPIEHMYVLCKSNFMESLK